jgi:hypothetical protein
VASAARRHGAAPAERRPELTASRMLRGAAFFLVLLAVVLGHGPVAATAQPATTSQPDSPSPPGPEAPAAPAEDEAPQVVTVGTYIQDLSNVDLKAGTFRADFYLWFVWRGERDPSLTYEFTNAIRQELSAVPTGLDDAGNPKPDELEDGRRIQIFRVQGRFVEAFDVEEYPLDDQDLVISIEDAETDNSTLVYEIDPGTATRPDLSIIGWEPQPMRNTVSPHKYVTTFGYPGEESSVFSRADFRVPVERPGVARLVQVVFPLAVIIMVALMSLVIDPPSLEATLFLAPPALIAAVALHFTTTTGLPSEGRVLLVDRIYLLCYLVILLVIAFGVFSHRQRDRGRAKRARLVDRVGLITLVPLFLGGTALLIVFR